MGSLRPFATATVELMRQDAAVADVGGLTESRRLAIDEEGDRFRDGPATGRLAVIDTDPVTGAPAPAVPFVVRNPTAPTHGAYGAPGAERTSAEFIAVNAFGTAFDTLSMFEEPAALGRRVRWAFGDEPLRIVPRAGAKANAYYHRATKCLKFFFLPTPARTVYTALSRDIVAHETGHALLDAVAPWLHDAITPQSLALHEAVADLIAVLMSVRRPKLRIALLEGKERSLRRATALASIAEEFGRARPAPDGTPRTALRDLANDSTMDDLAGARFHVLSTVLSGLFYDTLVDMFDSICREEVARGTPIEPARGKALGSAAIVFQRLLLRAIDYLPPGELTFADFGRAALAADRAAIRDADDVDMAEARRRFAGRFVARRIVTDASALETRDPSELGPSDVPLEALRDDEAAAAAFVARQRDLLGVPVGATPTVVARVDSTKQIGRRRPSGGYATQRELILKISWEHVEPNPGGEFGATSRSVRTGTTLAFRWSDARPIALVHSDTTRPPATAERDASIASLAHEIASRTGPGDPGEPPGLPTIRVSDRCLEVAGTYLLVHPLASG